MITRSNWLSRINFIKNSRHPLFRAWRWRLCHSWSLWRRRATSISCYSLPWGVPNRSQWVVSLHIISQASYEELLQNLYPLNMIRIFVLVLYENLANQQQKCQSSGVDSSFRDMLNFYAWYTNRKLYEHIKSKYKHDSLKASPSFWMEKHKAPPSFSHDCPFLWLFEENYLKRDIKNHSVYLITVELRRMPTFFNMCGRHAHTFNYRSWYPQMRKKIRNNWKLNKSYMSKVFLTTILPCICNPHESCNAISTGLLVIEELRLSSLC